MKKKWITSSALLLCSAVVVSACGYDQAGNDHTNQTQSYRGAGVNQAGTFGTWGNNGNNQNTAGIRNNNNANGAGAIASSNGISSFLESQLRAAGITGARVLVLDDTVVIGRSYRDIRDVNRGTNKGNTNTAGTRGTRGGATGFTWGGTGNGDMDTRSIGTGNGLGTGAGGSVNGLGGMANGTGGTGNGMGGTGNGAGANGMEDAGILGNNGNGRGAGQRALGNDGNGTGNNAQGNIGGSDLEQARSIVRGMFGNNVQILMVYNEKAISAMERVKANLKQSDFDDNKIATDVQYIIDQAQNDSGDMTGRARDTNGGNLNGR